tara:strand:- start:915 stop:1322 length:408 start_codon:yes stop_codon:yes gene_type:complete
MLKIESEKITLTRNIKVYINFLSDLNNYKVLFPKDKISDWKSDNDSCSLKVQNVYTLEMIKESVSKNSINLISGGSSPFKFSLKIDLHEDQNNICFAQIICNANVSPVLKMMIGKPLNELFNYMANQIEEAIITE